MGIALRRFVIMMCWLWLRSAWVMMVLVLWATLRRVDVDSVVLMVLVTCYLLLSMDLTLISVYSRLGRLVSGLRGTAVVQ